MEWWPRRRWLRFSLRTLLLFTTLIAVWLGSQVNRAQKQRTAAVTILEAGGQLHFVEERPWAWLGPIAGKGDFDNVVQVWFIADSIDESCLSALREFPNLITLVLFFPVTDSHLEQISELRHLEDVHLRGGLVTDAALERFAGLANITGVYVYEKKKHFDRWGTPLGNEGFSLTGQTIVNRIPVRTALDDTVCKHQKPK